MTPRQPLGSRIGDFLFALFLELPVAIWLGTQKPLWQEPPLVIALWIGGFALGFVVLFKIARRRSALQDFLATGRRASHRKYPKEVRPMAVSQSSTVSPPAKHR